MTAKEAIKELSEWLGGCCGDELEPTREALRMAITALEAQLDKDTNVPNNDTISRQAAIDIAKNLIVQMNEYHQYNQAINNYCAELVQLPPVQPEIIRCKDCMYYRHNNHDSWCNNNKGLDEPMPTDFCSRAERKTDG